MWRQTLKVGSAAVLAASGLDRLYACTSGRSQRPFVLGYHRIVPEYRPDPRTVLQPMQTSAAMLEAHLDWLGRHYRLVSIDELAAAVESGAPSGHLAAVTVDDGYRDAYEVAFPIFRRKGIPAAFFVVSDIVGTREVLIFDRLYYQLAQAHERGCGIPPRFVRALDAAGTPPEAVQEICRTPNPYDALQGILRRLSHEELLPVLDEAEVECPMPATVASDLAIVDWPMLRTMQAAGMTIGSHTCSHIFLSREAPGRISSELVRSKRALETQLKTPIRHFAYPAGEFHGLSAASVAQAGYRYAYTICDHGDRTEPVVTIPRTVFWEMTCAGAQGQFSPSLMQAQARGLFELVKPRCVLDHAPAAAAHPVRVAAQAQGGEC
jgi:peptidoglycan/xylan/chitin deacetylase (PgdA/CDA1 family)